MNIPISNDGGGCDDPAIILQTAPEMPTCEMETAREIGNYIIRLLKMSTEHSKLTYLNREVSGTVLTNTVTYLNQLGVGKVKLVKKGMLKPAYSLFIENPFYSGETKQR